MPIDLSTNRPFFVPHKDFMEEYKGDFTREKTMFSLQVKSKFSFDSIKKAFDNLFIKKEELLYFEYKKDKRQRNAYYFKLNDYSAKYSFLELALFHGYFFSSIDIIDPTNSTIPIQDLVLPFKTIISDDSPFYIIKSKNLHFEVILH